jgi:hypothetical protein
MTKAGDLVSRVAEVQEKARQQKARQRLPGTPLPTNVVQLPIWPESTRGVPNMALRSALFGAVKKGPRPYLERAEIHAQDGITIRYTGGRLDQGDLDVWETVLHITRLQALGDKCIVTAYQLLKALGKTDTGKNRDTLERRLSRMKATGLDVKIGRYSYEGSLIDEVYRDDESRKYVIRLNPKLLALFEPDQFTHIDWTVRQELDGKPLAQWLHGYYASHAKPFPLRVETLHRLCGSEAVRMDHYRQDLRKALEAVREAKKIHHQDFTYTIEGDLVHVKKKPTGTQQRHLAKKTAHPKRRD